MSTRRSVASRPPDESRVSFAEDVAFYLTETPRQLPSRYLYDELGSSLFEAICRLPWYRITRTEQRLLRTHAGSIFDLLGPLARVVELGPGSGEKLVTLMASCAQKDVTVHLVDVSSAALEKAASALASPPSLAIVAHQATYEQGLRDMAHTRETRGQTLAIFLGSNIGNFDPPGADKFLLNVRAALGPGDALLIGTDLVTPETEMLLAYDDPLGVTAAFNRNLLVRVNRELGGDFDVNHFAHRAVWNGAASRVEMHLVSRTRQRVRVPAATIDVTFETGEHIWTESSYKYRVEDVAAILARAGFRTVGQWVDDSFALTLAKVAQG